MKEFLFYFVRYDLTKSLIKMNNGNRLHVHPLKDKVVPKKED